MMTDPLGDFLTRIRNAVMAQHEKVEVPASKMKANICKVLKEEGLIKSFKIVAKGPSDIKIKIQLKPQAIVGIQRISTPGLRIYRPHDKLPRILSGLGVAIVSTSRGVLSSRECKKQRIGGEVICSVW